jgi:hypothetical protein
MPLKREQHRTRHLEDQDSSEECPFRGVELVDAAEDGVATRAGQQVGRSVPADVADRIESVGECRDGDGDNGTVLTMLAASYLRSAGCSLRSYQGNEEDGHVHANHNCEKFGRPGFEFDIAIVVTVDLVARFARLLVVGVGGRHRERFVELSL